MQFWKDDAGRIIILQLPNPLLWGWIASVVASFFVQGTALAAGVQFLRTSFLFAWAWLELTDGVNGFRRTLGAAVLLVLIIGHFS